MENHEMKVVARMESDFSTKFGIPRQSGVVEELRSRIVFEPEFRNPDALRGIEHFSHLWLIWQFSEAVRGEWSPTVRPPRLGGNTRMGVFATRSPFRPNPLGLSCVRLLGIEHDEEKGDVLIVGGADLMNGTPIYDIKPYVPYSDRLEEASEGFAPGVWARELELDFPEELLAKIPEGKRGGLLGVLRNDPRPSYHRDPERVYGMDFGGRNIKFTVRDGILSVVAVEESQL